MADWWEEGAFSEPDTTSEEVGRSAGRAATLPGREREAGRGGYWRSVVVLIALAVLAVAVRGFDMWRGQQRASAQQRDALRRMMAQELEACRLGNVEAYSALLDPAASQQWRAKQIQALTVVSSPPSNEEPPIIERWRFRSDAAMVDVRFTGPPAIRETRFYRLVDGIWHRTSPISAFWGDRQGAGAPGIHFIYREADAEAVEGAIETLRTTYQQGALSVLAGDRLTIEIVPDDFIEYDSQDHRLLLPSPRLSPRLASVPDSGPILWRLAHPVADRLLDPADAARYRYLDSTQMFQDHLRYWTLRWQAPFPERWQMQMLDTLRTAREEDRLIQLRAIDLFSAGRTQSYLAYYEALVMADYVAEEYGSHKLRALEQALGQAPTWDRAIAATLGIDNADFEHGWRAFLDTKLAPSPPRSPEVTPTPNS